MGQITRLTTRDPPIYYLTVCDLPPSLRLRAAAARAQAHAAA